MATDPLNPLEGLPSFFFPGDAKDPRVNQALRQRIALQMMSKGRPFPKNVGEGLTAIGDSLGDIGIMRRLEQGDLAQQEAAKAAADAALTGGGPPAVATRTSSYAPPDRSVAPAVAAIDAAIAPREEAPAEQPAPPPGLTTSAQPPSMLSPNTVAVAPGQLGGPAPPMSPAQGRPYMDPRATRQPMINNPPPGRFAGVSELDMPGRGVNAPPVMPGVAGGGYNSIDAQAGLPNSSRTPGYLQGAIERNIPDNPDFQAYAGTMSAREAPRGPTDTSSTGATGPYQFTRGTGRQYGLSDVAARQDPEASTAAFRDFTTDNAAIFERINGRPPTMAELAVMHQQGGQTGANMMAGTGNASPGNLAVNNINPNAGPAQAVAKIKGFYGLPEQPLDPRAAATNAIMARQGGPQPNPMPAGPQGPSAAPPPSASAVPPGGPADRRLVMAADDTGLPPGIRMAPPQSQVRAVPQRTAQAGPYDMPEPKPPNPEPMSQDEVRIRKAIRDNQNNPYVAQQLADPLSVLENNRRAIDARNIEDYKAKLQNFNAVELKRREYQADTPKRDIELGRLRSEADVKATEARIVNRTGMAPDKLYERYDKDKAAIDQTVQAQGAQQLARSAINAGVITGYGANGILASAKFANWAFNNGLKGDLAANTETMSAALKFGLTNAIETINGVGGKVSDSDLKIAQGMQATDPTLQLQTIKTIMDRAAKINFDKIHSYETKLEHDLAGEPAEVRYTPSLNTLIPPDHVKMLEDSQKDPAKAEQTKAYFDRTYGPGASDFALKRLERQRARDQR